MRGLSKYRIVLLVLGVFTLGLFILVIVQAGGVKQDAETYTKATKISEELNNYMYGADKLPSSFSDAKISNVPSSVTYKKVSETTYEFCVNYKQASSGFDATALETKVLTGGAYGGDSQQNSSYQASSLFLMATHHAGKNCQTIKPVFYSSYNYKDTYPSSSSKITSPSSSSSSSTSSLSALDKCEAIYDDTKSYTENVAYNNCIDDYYKTVK